MNQQQERTDLLAYPQVDVLIATASLDDCLMGMHTTVTTNDKSDIPKLDRLGRTCRVLMSTYLRDGISEMWLETARQCIRFYVWKADLSIDGMSQLLSVIVTGERRSQTEQKHNVFINRLTSTDLYRLLTVALKHGIEPAFILVSSFIGRDSYLSEQVSILKQLNQTIIITNTHRQPIINLFGLLFGQNQIATEMVLELLEEGLVDTLMEILPTVNDNTVRSILLLLYFINQQLAKDCSNFWEMYLSLLYSRNFEEMVSHLHFGIWMVYIDRIRESISEWRNNPSMMSL